MEIYWLWLSQINGIGPVTSKKLLKHFENPYNIYMANKDDIESAAILNKKQLNEITTEKSLKTAEKIIAYCKRKDIKIINYNDDLYKEKAKKCTKAPILLFYKGTILPESLSIGIVGARRCTDYGKSVTVDTVNYLTENNVTIVSGMAKGIDGYAHTACLKNNGYIIAFLEHGVDTCYPPEHSNLMNKIIENGAVISEFLPGTGIAKSNFVKRNYLLSTWCDKLLVVEAAEKSGALTTARFANENGTEVYAAPNNIYSKESIGTNNLIKSYAKIYLCPSQLLGKEESLKNNNKDNTYNDIDHSKMTPLQYKIFTLIREKIMTTEEIIFAIREDKGSIIEAISMMEIEGIIEYTHRGVRPLGKIVSEKGQTPGEKCSMPDPHIGF